MPQLFLLLSLLLLTTTAQSSSRRSLSEGGPSIPANRQVGDQWHYELLWTIDAPELRGDNPPTTILAYPVFEVLEADKDGYTLRVHGDSARVVTGPTGQQGKAAVVHFQLTYLIRTTPEGRYAGVQNADSLSAELLRLYQKVYMKSDAVSAHKRIVAIPAWEEAFFLRDYGFIFDAYGRKMKDGRKTELPLTPGRKFYYLYNDVPLDITFFDEKFGKPTVMTETMVFVKQPNGIRAEAEGHFTHPAVEEAQGPFTFQYEEKKGYYRSSAVYDPESGRFLEGELVFGTSGGGGQYLYEGKPEKLPEQLIEERRSFKSIFPDESVEMVAVNDLQGIRFPDFPQYAEVVRHFYQQYKGSSVPEFRLTKHPEGYRITRLTDDNREMFDPEWIWTPSGGWQPVAHFDKPEPVDPDAPERVAEVYNPYEWEEYADRHLRYNVYQQQECDRQPYFGYPGFYYDVIDLLEPQYEALSNDQLHTLARCYSFAKSGLLNNNSGYADSTRIFPLQPGQNALNPEQLAQYIAAHEKAVEAYAVLMQRDPSFSTPVGTVRTKYANEAMDGYLTLLYYQNETAARSLLRAGLYDPYMLQTARNILESCPQDAILISYGDSDTYPLLYLQAIEQRRRDVVVANVSLLNIPSYYQYLTKGAPGAEALNSLLPERFFRENILLVRKPEADPETTPKAVDLLTGLEQGEFSGPDYGYLTLKMPVTRLVLPAAPAPASFPGREPEEVAWETKEAYLTLNTLAMLDMVAANEWKRPLCFSLTCDPRIFAPWQGHLALEGMVYRVFPNELPRFRWDGYAISAEKSLDLWRNAFSFDAKQVPLTGEMIPFYQGQLFACIDLAQDLQKAGRCADALGMADLLDRHFTDAMRPRNHFWIDLVEVCAACGQPELAEKLGLQVWDNFLKKKWEEHYLQFGEQVRKALRGLAEEYGLEKLKNLK